MKAFSVEKILFFIFFIYVYFPDAHNHNDKEYERFILYYKNLATKVDMKNLKFKDEKNIEGLYEKNIQTRFVVSSKFDIKNYSNLFSYTLTFSDCVLENKNFIDTLYIPDYDSDIYIGEQLYPNYSEKDYLKQVDSTKVLKIMKVEQIGEWQFHSAVKWDKTLKTRKLDGNYYIYVLCNRYFLENYIYSLITDFMENMDNWKEKGYEYEEQELPFDSYLIAKGCDKILISKHLRKDTILYLLEHFETCETGEFISSFLLSHDCDSLKSLMEKYGICLPFLPENGKVLFIESSDVYFKGIEKYWIQLQCPHNYEGIKTRLEIEIKNYKIVEFKLW